VLCVFPCLQRHSIIGPGGLNFHSNGSPRTCFSSIRCTDVRALQIVVLPQAFFRTTFNAFSFAAFPNVS
jgi:hypothetical protein